MKQINREQARKYLGDVSPEQCFWINNGPIIKNLEELANFLPNIDDGIFHHHVNKDKNDFAAWVNDVIGDRELAKSLMSANNRNSVLKNLKIRINSLKKKAG